MAAVAGLLGASLAAGAAPTPASHQPGRTHPHPAAVTHARAAKLTHPATHPRAAAPEAAKKPLMTPPAISALGPPSPPETLPFIYRPLPALPRPMLNPLPRAYGGGGGTVLLPSGGSFGAPPIAGGSFGGGRPTGGSFGNGHIR